MSIKSAESLSVNQDATRAAKKPSKALLYAALIPGGGQIYNGHYFKLPVLYGGYAFFLYRATDARTDYLCHNQALIEFLDDDVEDPGPNYACRGRTYQFENFSANGYRAGRDQFRQSMELNFIFASLLHIASIIDAYVYAHLDSFDTDDDLSFKMIMPDPQLSLGYQSLPRVGLVYSF